MFQTISEALVLRVVQHQGFSRCGGTFSPLHKEGTVAAVQRKLKKLGWLIAPESVSWAYDVLGAANGAGTPAHSKANCYSPCSLTVSRATERRQERPLECCSVTALVP